MLYPKKHEKLSRELFANPTSEYRGTPFWAWNCELEKNELLRQLDVMKQMGLGGAHMHVRTGMATPYLSDEHMDLIRACVDKCKQEKMLAWLYDEDRWPSGAAGGIVTKEEKYRQRYLLLTRTPQDEMLLACYDILLNEDGTLADYRRIAEEEAAQGQKWYAYRKIESPSPWYNNQTYVNTLDPAAMRRFIEVTYDRYLETVGEEFGKTVPAIFTDEPQFTFKKPLPFADSQEQAVMPWSDDLPTTFAAAYGEDLMAHLPEIFWDLPEGAPSVIRYRFHDHVCERFTQAFADQCGGWCGAHGLMLTGHMLHEPTLGSQTTGIGEAMRAYRSFQLPGIDMLCNWKEFTTAKQAQSAVHQYGREGMLSELYGVTGWDFDFRGHKFQGDWQAALGVTVRVHHLFWVSMKGEAKRDYPASIGYQSPWWQDYAAVEDHFARVSTALTRGKPLVKVGMIHPIESYWLAFGPNEQTLSARQQMNTRFENVTNWMLSGLIDFDFICESLLPEQCATASAPLQVGEMAYDAIVVPACDTLRATTLERLEAFAAAGGQLIFMGKAPRYCDAVPSERGRKLWEKSTHIDFDAQALMEQLQPLRLVDIRRPNGSRTDDLIYQMRQDGDDRWLFLAHNRQSSNPDISIPFDLHLTLDGVYQVEEYDTQTGEIRPLAVTHKGGKTLFDKTIYINDSLLVRLTHDEVGTPIESEARNSEKLPVPMLVDFTRNEPNVLLLDKAEFALDDQDWRPSKELLQADNDLRRDLDLPMRMSHVAQPWTVDEPTPEHTVRLRFAVHSRIQTPASLALEDADIAAITFNGTAVPINVDGWFVDKSIGVRPLGNLQIGENIIEVTLPFGQRTNVEYCYLLGEFGVAIMGEHREITDAPTKLGFDSITHQGLAHYTGNITYRIPVTTKAGKIRITTPHYVGAAVKVRVDGAQDRIIYPPYQCVLPVSEGRHMLEITVLGNRFNAFGHLHAGEQTNVWVGPNIWRTLDNWTESYRLRPLGLLSAPIIEQLF